MKYTSVFIVIVLMAWTWSLATTERSFKLEQHKAVEAGVEKDVRAFILRKFPEANEIYCSQLFTEIVDPGKELVARFRCQANGAVGKDIAQQTYEGFINLKSDDQFQSWSETGGEIRSPAITFQNGIQISTKDKLEDTVPAEDASQKQKLEKAPEVPREDAK